MKKGKKTIKEASPVPQKKRKYSYDGPVDRIKIGNLVINTNNFKDEEIDMYLKEYPRLSEYFKKVE